jgi:hypothetical protein
MATVHGSAHQAVTPVISRLPKVSLSKQTVLVGTAHGSFFAHEGSATSGTIYNVYASGNIPPVGPTLLVGGFQTSGFTRTGKAGGNIILGFESLRGDLDLRLTAMASPSAQAAGQYEFVYVITQGSGAFANARGSGTLTITLDPINTNIHGEPVSNPGFFGNSTLSFSPAASSVV